MGITRSQAHGELDQSSNPFRTISRELSVLYDAAPVVRHDDEARADVRAFLSPAGPVVSSSLWAQMSWFQSRVIGLREMLLRVDVNQEGELHYRPVPPDMVLCESHQSYPDRPVKICELRARSIGGAVAWTWDVYDISDPQNPSYRVLLDDKSGEPNGADITEEILGRTFVGEDYWYRRADGTPVLPWVLYHAQRRSDRLWDTYEGIEVVEGTVNLAIAYSYLFHALRDASWAQRWLVNLRPAGLGVDTTSLGARAEVTTDPATVLLLESTADAAEGGQPMVGQWSSPSDVEGMERAISAMANRLAQDAGIPPSDIQRMGGTARSGYAISLSNDGKRVAQRRFAPQFQDHDRNLLGLSALMVNRATGSALPEDGYAVVYSQIPLSPSEIKERRANVLELLEAKLIDRVSAYMEVHPGLTEAQAAADLDAIDNGQRGEVRSGASIPVLPLPTGAGEKLQDTALNGAQVQAAQAIVSGVSAGQIPRATGVEMLSSFFNLPPAVAESIMGTVGGTFNPRPIA